MKTTEMSINVYHVTYNQGEHEGVSISSWMMSLTLKGLEEKEEEIKAKLDR